LWWGKVQVPYFLIALMLAGIATVQNWSFRRHKVWSQEQRREALRHNYEHALLVHSSNEIYMFEADTLLFTYANEFALNNLGYSLAELRQRTFLSLHPEMNAETFARLITPLHRGEQESVRYRTVQARADGSTYPVEINLQLFTSDVHSGCLAIINDITALRQAEENVSKFSAPMERRTVAR
jgi:PAS domain S-box-containing protein